MVFDLAAGARTHRFIPDEHAAITRPPRILVFDSGLGGLTVYREIAKVRPDAVFLYAADDAVFPYGALSEPVLVARVLALMEILIAEHDPDVVVVACNTASTLVLGPLRARWPGVAFVGTVPAIKPAAALSVTRMISVVATPGCVAREYTHELVRTFASDCRVTLVGATRLAGFAESLMRGEPVGRDAIAAEIAPAFVETGDRRTDAVVLACTHYPLLLAELRAVAPWPVTWIDPAPAIARRVGQVAEAGGFVQGDMPERPSRLAPAVFTRNSEPGEALDGFLAACNLRWERSDSFAVLSGNERRR